jgi:very-short-patch-repair endonuclease
MYELARRQYGLIARAQAYDLGVTPARIKQELRADRWIRVLPGVFRINGTPLTWQGRMLAFCLAVGPQAVVSHRSAAALWDLAGFGPPGRVDLTVSEDHHPRLPGARLHRSRAYDLIAATTKQQVPVTGIGRTLLDVCAAVDDDFGGLRALDDARRRGLVGWPELWETLVLHARRGRPGVARFRRLLDLRAGKQVPEGVFEALVQRLLVDAGLPEFEPRHWVTAAGRRYRFDLASPREMVAVECDGRIGHGHERAFEDDRVRDNDLKLAGWLVLHYTWRRLVDNPEAIVAEVREALVGRGLRLAV